MSRWWRRRKTEIDIWWWYGGEKTTETLSFWWREIQCGDVGSAEKKRYKSGGGVGGGGGNKLNTIKVKGKLKKNEMMAQRKFSQAEAHCITVKDNRPQLRPVLGSHLDE